MLAPYMLTATLRRLISPTTFAPRWRPARSASTLQLLVHARHSEPPLPAEVFGFGRGATRDSLRCSRSGELQLVYPRTRHRRQLPFLPRTKERLDRTSLVSSDTTVTLAAPAARRPAASLLLASLCCRGDSPPSDPPGPHRPASSSGAPPGGLAEPAPSSRLTARRDDLQRSLQLRAWPRNHLPLVRKLDRLSRRAAP
jgi:hypothetical protein